MTEDEIIAEIDAVERRYRRELVGIHVSAFIQIHLIIVGLGGTLWLLHRVLIG